jgi:hypothetical protein
MGILHHQPINVTTAGAQTFLMDYTQGERAVTHHAGPVRIGGFEYFSLLKYGNIISARK